MNRQVFIQSVHPEIHDHKLSFFLSNALFKNFILLQLLGKSVPRSGNLKVTLSLQGENFPVLLSSESIKSLDSLSSSSSSSSSSTPSILSSSSSSSSSSKTRLIHSFTDLSSSSIETPIKSFNYKSTLDDVNEKQNVGRGRSMNHTHDAHIKNDRNDENDNNNEDGIPIDLHTNLIFREPSIDSKSNEESYIQELHSKFSNLSINAKGNVRSMNQQSYQQSTQKWKKEESYERKEKHEGGNDNSHCVISFGAYSSQLQLLRETLSLALDIPYHQDVSKNQEINPNSLKNSNIGYHMLNKMLLIPRGVLIHGLSGTGKTLLARKVIQELMNKMIDKNEALQVIEMRASDFNSREYGSNEWKLKSMFEKAFKTSSTDITSQGISPFPTLLTSKSQNAKKRTIFVLDELEMLCPQRNQLVTEGSKRFISTLLNQLDQIPKMCANNESVYVAVIGITSEISKVEPAIRRPGRLDREIEMTVPTVNERELILRILVPNVKLEGNINIENNGNYHDNDDDDNDAHEINHGNMGENNGEDESKSEEETRNEIIKKLAAISHGYVAADLKAVIQEATSYRMMLGSNIVDKNDKDLILPMQTSKRDCRLRFEDFEHALAIVKPSAIREVLVEVPHVKWCDIGGQDEVKQVLCEAVEWQFKHEEAFGRFGIRPPKGILLYGPPGCSKTMVAKALATEAKLNFIAVKGPELFSKWVGESEKAVREVFRKARASQPSIVFFDEIDGLAVERGMNGEGGVGDRVLSQLLSELDGMSKLTGVTIIAATNRPDLLDSALLRPGRIDRVVYVRPPDWKARRQIVLMYLKRIKSKEEQEKANVDLDKIASLTEGYSGAEVVAVCKEAAYLSLQEDINAVAIRQQHLENAIKQVKPRLNKEMMSFYENFENKKTKK